MNILNKVKSLFNATEAYAPSVSAQDFFRCSPIISDISNATSEVTYFTCLKLLAETMGKLSIDLYQSTDKGDIKITDHEVYQLLKYRPNKYSTPTIFKAQIEYQRNHYGNAYVLIESNKSKITGLHLLDFNCTEVIVDNDGLFGPTGNLYYRYTDPHTLKTYTFKEENVLHFKTAFLKEGIIGMPVQEILHDTIKGAHASQKFLNNLTEKGFSAKAVLQYSGDLDNKHRRALQRDLEEMGGGYDNSGRIVPLPFGFELKTLDMKLADSQFIDLKKFTALQIASVFGMKPVHINNFDKGATYSSLDSQNLSFYTDTLLFVLRHYEEELNYKMLTNKERLKGYHFKFNVSSILRADLKTQAEVLCMYRNNGIYTGNECRQMLDFPLHNDADDLLMNGNYIPVKMAGEQYRKGGDTENEQRESA